MDLEKRLEFSREIAKAADVRNKAIAALGLDANDTSNQWDVLKTAFEWRTRPGTRPDQSERTSGAFLSAGSESVKATGAKFVIEVQAMPGWNVPAAKRLRAFLKAAKRQAGFRCTRLRESGRQNSAQPTEVTP